mmetsp:Transcript_78763/g.154026  ORF Transcript_78763/g.154026 Transcript_78763/m.154026 type:complete len:115 (+) Transcript_78763:199-543(+)
MECCSIVLEVKIFTNFSFVYHTLGDIARLCTWGLCNEPAENHCRTTPMPSFAVNVDALTFFFELCDKLDGGTETGKRWLVVINGRYMELLYSEPCIFFSWTSVLVTKIYDAPDT